jgi:hypothetical protein
VTEEAVVGEDGTDFAGEIDAVVRLLFSPRRPSQREKDQECRDAREALHA